MNPESNIAVPVGLREVCAISGIKDTGINRVSPWGHADTALISTEARVAGVGRQEWGEQVGEAEGEGGASAGKGKHRLLESVVTLPTPALLGREGRVTV